MVRLGIIGLGFIGLRHVKAIEACAGVELSGIVEPDPSRRKTFSGRGVPIFASMEEMLDRVELNGVIVATPSDSHASITVACLKRGVHALVEKPIATTIEDADRIIDAAERSGRHVLVGYNRRHLDVVDKTRQILRDEVGNLVALNGQWTVRKPDTYFEPRWRQQKAAGPVLINLTHEIDLLRAFCGDIESVTALGSNKLRQFEKEDVVALVLAFRNGVLGTFLLSDSAHSPWAWELATGETAEFKATGQNTHRFVGDAGSLEFPNLIHWRSGEGNASWLTGIQPRRVSVSHGDSFQRQISHFRDVLQGIAKPLVTAWDGRETLRTTLAVQRSISSGETVYL